MLCDASSEFQPLSRCTASGRNPLRFARYSTYELSTPPETPTMQSYSLPFPSARIFCRNRSRSAVRSASSRRTAVSFAW
jgi:hypothetical protein